MALTYPFLPPGHFKFPVITEYGKERRCQESYLNEFDEVVFHKAWTLFCACLIMAQVAKVVSLKKDSPRGLKLATDLMNVSKAFCSNEVESKGAQNCKKRKRRRRGY